MKKYLKKIKLKFKITRHIYIITATIIIFIGASFYFYDPYDFFKAMRNKTREKHLGILEDVMKRYQKDHPNDDIFSTMTEYPRCIGTNKSEGKSVWQTMIYSNFIDGVPIKAEDNNSDITTDSKGDTYIAWRALQSNENNEIKNPYSQTDETQINKKAFNLYLKEIGIRGEIYPDTQEYKVVKLTNYTSNIYGGGAHNPHIIFSRPDKALVVAWNYREMESLTSFSKTILYIQKFSLDGKPIWIEPKKITESGEIHYLTMDDSNPSNIIVIWDDSSRRLKMQKIDKDGNLLFKTQDEIDLPVDSEKDAMIDGKGDIIISKPVRKWVNGKEIYFSWEMPYEYFPDIILKVDSKTKQIKWLKEFNRDEVIGSFTVDMNNNVVVFLRAANMDLYAYKFSSDGKEIWKKPIKVESEIYGGYVHKISKAIINKDKGIIFIPVTIGDDSSRKEVALLVIDSAHGTVFSKATPMSHDQLNNIIADENGDLRIIWSGLRQELFVERIDIGCYDFTSRLTPKYISHLPEDPIKGNKSDTKYGIAKVNNNTFSIEALYSEKVKNEKKVIIMWFDF